MCTVQLRLSVSRCHITFLDIDVLIIYGTSDSRDNFASVPLLMMTSWNVFSGVGKRPHDTFQWLLLFYEFTRAVCKVRGLTLLLQVGTLWRCGDGLFFEVPSLASAALLATLHPRLENVLQTVDHFEISCLETPFSWLKKPRNRMELNSVFGLEKVDRWNPIRTSTIQCKSHPMRILGFSSHEKGAPRQEISKWSTVCSMFSRSGWSVVRSVSFDKGGTSEKRPLPHLHKVPTRSNEANPRTFQTAFI
jgi:hypothetical protein